ncbi:MAG: hypothetical protein COA81_08610 [Alphaproteobacteria bacterium]|nr:MAG: hypothetical protein COA81_08610 [Alphaproteobacteria bacterium]
MFNNISKNLGKVVGATVVFLGMMVSAPAWAVPVERDLYVTDSQSGNIFAITPTKAITILVSEADILAATGATTARFTDNGVYYDQANDKLYFTDSESDAVLVWDGATGIVSVVASAADIEAAVPGNDSASPEHITLRDGMLYVTDPRSDTLLKIDAATGVVTVVTDEVTFEGVAPDGLDVDIESGIAVSPDGTKIYVAHDEDRSSDTAGAIYEVDLLTGTPTLLSDDSRFSDLDVFLTLAPNGDIIIANDAGSTGDQIFRVTPGGVVSGFLSELELEGLVGGDVNLEGGIIFDDFGNFYVAEENTDNIYRWLVDDFSAGTIDVSSGALFVSENDVASLFGLTGIDYEGGITFGRASIQHDVPEPASMALLGFGLLGLGLARRRRH